MSSTTSSLPQSSTTSQSQTTYRRNQESSDDHCEVYQRCILEHEFRNHEAFLSVDVQRVQNGVYTDPGKLCFYEKSCPATVVTFVELRFTFHPMNSVKHRFQRAVIGVLARDKRVRDGETTAPLKVLKFAPHLAYGRVSTETLHWTFALSATLGVAQAPVTAALTPSMGFDNTRIIDAMPKIQGSTRTHLCVESGKLVWSLEENQQQSTGLPREFAFIMLFERRNPESDLELAVSIKPTFSKDMAAKISKHDLVQGDWMNVGHEPVGQRFSTSPFNFATMPGQFEDLIQLPGQVIRLEVGRFRAL
jgi:hypothetical protein